MKTTARMMRKREREMERKEMAGGCMTILVTCDVAVNPCDKSTRVGACAKNLVSPTRHYGRLLA